MPIARASRGAHPRGSSTVPVTVLLVVSIASVALGAAGDRLIERARDVFAAPPAIAAIEGEEPAPLVARSFPREASALRAALEVSHPPTVLAELVGRLGLMGDSTDVARLEPLLAHRSPLVRHGVLSAFARLGGDEAVERVAAYAQGPMGDPDTYPAIQALAHSESPEAEALLIGLVRGDEQWRRDAGLAALSMRGGPNARRILHRELLNGPAMQAWMAAHNVARLGEPVDARLLMKVASGTGQKADAALGALGALPGGNVDAFLIEMADMATGDRRGTLLSALGQVQDPAALTVLSAALDGPARWRAHAWQALGVIRAPGAFEVMLERLPETRPADAQSVSGALGARPEQEAREVLRTLASGDDALAEACLGTLASLEDLATTELLLARYDDDGQLPPGQSLLFLATRGGEEGWQLLEEVLAEGGQGDRNSVVWALQMRGDEDARDRLMELARSGDSMVAPQALGALENMGDEARDALRELLVERVDSGDINDWGQSMQTLARLGGDQAREIILGRVNEGTAQERSNAVSALSQMDDPEARDALKDLFRTSEDPSLKSQALNSLLWSAEGVDAELLDEALASEDPAVVAQVVGALPHSGGNDVNERLLSFADADDPTVRSAALGALAQSGGAEAEAALLIALDDPEVAAQAVWNLQSMGTPGAREALRAAAQSDDSALRGQAIGALGTDMSDEADELLRGALNSDDDAVVTSAISALQGRGTTSSAQAIAEALESMDDPTSSAGVQAAWALSAIGGSVAETYAELIAEAQGSGDVGAEVLHFGGELQHLLLD